MRLSSPEKLLLLVVTVCFSLVITADISAELKKEYVQYKDGDTVLEGYLVYDSDIEGKKPAVIVVHEWWGLTVHPKKSAEKLAQLGYVAFALDMYGKGNVTNERSQAAKWAGEVRGNHKLLKSRFEAGLKALKDNDHVDPERISAIGYCFGGTVCLEAARMGFDLTGVVSFHGGLKSSVPEEDRNIRAKVLVCHGANDPAVPPDEVATFQQEMRDAGVDWVMVSYGNTVHSFTNPAAGNDPLRGNAYNETSAKRAWEAMKSFLEEVSNIK